MTRAEAIKEINTMLFCIEIGNQEGRISLGTVQEIKEALEIAVNSLQIDEKYHLESENAGEFIKKSVLEDIKAEIEKLENYVLGYTYDDGVADCLNIIDKYIGGEGEET